MRHLFYSQHMVMQMKRMTTLGSRLPVFLFFVAVGFSNCKKSSAPTPNPPVTDTTTFTNPLLSSGPDPWIIQQGTTYYYTHTLGNRIDIWKTGKVSELNKADRQTVWTAPASGSNSQNIWAPEIHFVDNKWYAYYTAGSSADLNTQRTFVLENSSADPLAGSWTDKGQIKDAAADFFAIDGTIFNHNGSNYFIWSGHANATDNNQRLYIARMTNPWTLQTSRSMISEPTLVWETAGAPPAVNEGPEILKNASGKIFLIYSASGCWTDEYKLGMLTLKDGGDPLKAADWTKSVNPVFLKKPAAGAYGPGHNAFFKSKDGTEDWILYHANSSPGQGCGDLRSPRMQKFTWNADGTPNFGEPVGLNTPIKKPSGE
jgi:GH43 family beta-xylosidase